MCTVNVFPCSIFYWAAHEGQHPVKKMRSKLTTAVLAQSVERVDCRAGGRGFDSRGRTNTQGLKLTEK